LGKAYTCLCSSGGVSGLSLVFIFRKMPRGRSRFPPRTPLSSRRGRAGPKKVQNKGGESFRSMTVRSPLSFHCALPMQLRTRFTASGMFSIAGTTPSATMNFIANSCVLPFATTNGSAALTWYGLTIGSFYPAFFHSIINASVYTQFIVEKVLFEFDATPQSVQDSIIWTGSPSMTGSVPSSVPNAMTRPWTKQMGFRSARPATPDYPFRHMIDIAKFLGISRSAYRNDTSGAFYGEPTASPLVTIPYVVNFETGDNVGLTTALEVRVRVTYFTLCRELNTTISTTSVSRTSPDPLVLPHSRIAKPFGSGFDHPAYLAEAKRHEIKCQENKRQFIERTEKDRVFAEDLDSHLRDDYAWDGRRPISVSGGPICRRHVEIRCPLPDISPDCEFGCKGHAARPKVLIRKVSGGGRDEKDDFEVLSPNLDGPGARHDDHYLTEDQLLNTMHAAYADLEGPTVRRFSSHYEPVPMVEPAGVTLHETACSLLTERIQQASLKD